MIDKGTTKVIQKTIEVTSNFADLNLDLIYKYLFDIKVCFPDIKITYNKKKIPKCSHEQFLELNGITQFYHYVYGGVEDKLDIYIFKP